jgi:hypothetical protein
LIGRPAFFSGRPAGAGCQIAVRPPPPPWLKRANAALSDAAGTHEFTTVIHPVFGAHHNDGWLRQTRLESRVAGSWLVSRSV